MATECVTDYPQKGVVRVIWPALDVNEAGQAAGVARWQEKTVQITNAMGTTALTIQGSNDGTNWATLHSKEMDADSAVPLSALSDPGMWSILENPLFIRPLVAAGGDTNDINVVLIGVAWD